MKENKGKDKGRSNSNYHVHNMIADVADTPFDVMDSCDNKENINWHNKLDMDTLVRQEIAKYTIWEAQHPKTECAHCHCPSPQWP